VPHFGDAAFMDRVENACRRLIKCSKGHGTVGGKIEEIKIRHRQDRAPSKKLQGILAEMEALLLEIDAKVLFASPECR
jgi:hypothetical protein